MSFGYVPSPAHEQFDKAREYLSPALDRYGYTWIECQRLIESNHAQLWMSDEAALVSRRDGDVLEIWLVGGKVVNASDQYAQVIEQAAKQAGMKSMRMTGRKGWIRHLAKWGWVQSGDDVIKEFAETD